MPPSSRILSSMSRTQFRTAFQRQQQIGIRRVSSAVRDTKAPGGAAKAEWGAHWRRVGGVAMMYFPVVGICMFWPYAVMPVMEYFEERW